MGGCARASLLGACVVLASACGRISFDAVTDGGDGDADAGIHYYMSPTGDDAADGSLVAPWRTFSRSLSALQPGETLDLLDGIYNAAAGTGTLDVDCRDPDCNGAPCVHGQPGAVIFVRSYHVRQAIIEGDGSMAPINIGHCSFWGVDGLVARNVDNAAGDTAHTISVSNSSDIIVRRTVASHPNRAGNWNALEINSADRSLVEDVEVYDFHADGFAIYESNNVVVRRVYANSRNTPDIAAYASQCPTTGDVGISLRAAGSSIVEDSIVEDTCRGVQIIVDDSQTGDTGWGDDNVVVNSITRNGAREGFRAFTACNTCNEPNAVASRNQIINSVSIGHNVGFESSGEVQTFTRVTAHQTTTRAIFLNGSSAPIIDSATVVGALLDGAAVGVYERAFETASVTGNLWTLTADTDITGATLVTSGSIDPQLGTCLVTLPPSSPMVAAGVGADIRVRYENGQATTKPFWSPIPSPCGLIVPGFNDTPVDSCSGVAARLEVGTPGCPL